MIIGTRTLHYHTSAGTQDIAIRLFMPTFADPKWDCRYEIDWPDGLWKSHVHGNDALHALHLALQKIGLDVYMSPYHKSGRLTWLESWIGYGFPVPKDGRDVLVGTDRQFYG